VKDRTRKVFAPIVAASIILYTPSAFALRGGPFENDRSSNESANGTYAGVLTGENLIGLTQFGIADNGEANGRFSIFHEGIMNYGVTEAIGDIGNRVIAGAFLGVAALPGETTGASGSPGSTGQAITVRSSAEGAFTARMENFPLNIQFSGDGQLSTEANPVTVTSPASGGTVVVHAPGTADNGGVLDPQSVNAVTSTTVESTTLRATTPFKIRGSRTSTVVFTPLNAFSAIPPIAPRTPSATPVPGGTPLP
jgi:hypothetical protein